MADWALEIEADDGSCPFERFVARTSRRSNAMPSTPRCDFGWAVTDLILRAASG